MKRGQVFVRALDPLGKWGKADILDLCEDSFKHWVIDKLWQLQMGPSHHPGDEDGVYGSKYRSRVLHHED